MSLDDPAVEVGGGVVEVVGEPASRSVKPIGQFVGLVCQAQQRQTGVESID
jgi:hypothetical protein